MRLESCSFCSAPCYPGSGIAFVRNDSRVFRFCRSKCHKAYKMRRNPRKVRWTKAFRKTAGKEMTIDATLEFEKRRNVPVKYDRELMATTVKAMQRVGEIRQKRVKAFWKNRMSTSAPASLERDALEVARSSHLLGQTPAPLTEKAIAAAAKKLASRDVRKRERQQQNRKRVLAAVTAVADDDVEMDDAAAETSLIDAVSAALATPGPAPSVPSDRDKIKIKVRNRKSALIQPARGQAMSMDL